MLINIKSSFFIKILFSYFHEKEKLKTVKYNKLLQNILGINIINYQIFSRKYIIYESNGIGKEYNSYHDRLEFEGEYKNGERNGKGREYNYEGHLLFKGEYKNGKRNGKGSEYYYNDGKIKFEGEYLYNFLFKGKLYINETLEYEGEFLFNRKYNGKWYDKNGNIIYELINGKGKVKKYDFVGKLLFVGEYFNGKKHGKGKEYFG